MEIDVEAVLAGYEKEITVLTRRAVIAEAQVRALKERAESEQGESK